MALIGLQLCPLSLLHRVSFYAFEMINVISMNGSVGLPRLHLSRSQPKIPIQLFPIIVISNRNIYCLTRSSFYAGSILSVLFCLSLSFFLFRSLELSMCVLEFLERGNGQ